MLKIVERGIMAYGSIKELFSYRYPRGCNSPTRLNNFHWSTNHSALGTISSNSLNIQWVEFFSPIEINLLNVENMNSTKKMPHNFISGIQCCKKYVDLVSLWLVQTWKIECPLNGYINRIWTLCNWKKQKSESRLDMYSTLDLEFK